MPQKDLDLVMAMSVATHNYTQSPNIVSFTKAGVLHWARSWTAGQRLLVLLVVTTGVGGDWHLVREARDAAKYPSVH